MRKLIVVEFMSLDGVVQSPMYPDEDPSGGFVHGGWAAGFMDKAAMKWCIANVTEAGGFLFGRRTYDNFAAHWPNASKEEEPLSVPLGARPKYVASKTLEAPLAWQHSELLQGDAVKAVAALKKQEGGDLVSFGSTELMHALLAAGLVDELRLMIDPVILGGGKRLFTDDGALKSWKLEHGKVTDTGAFLTRYVRS